jgi:acyl carrier protein
MSDVESARSGLAAWCASFIADLLECAPAEINPDTKFSRMGVDSAMSVQLAVALEERLGLQLSPDVIADHPTISRLVAYLSAIRPRSVA